MQCMNIDVQKLKACKKINKISLLTENTQTKQNTIIRQKQSLVHKVSSGVAIMSHVCGVAPKTSTLKFYLMWQMWGDKEFLSFINEKLEWESPPSILVTRNLNWSQRSSTGTGCVKGRYQHPKYAYLRQAACFIV